jgi:predicted Zn-dependent protease
MTRWDRRLAWPLCGLALGLLGSAAAAGLDLGSGAGISGQWLGAAPKKPIIPRSTPSGFARIYLTQAQEAPPDAPLAVAAEPDVGEAAAKAQMEQRWGEAERLYREALAKEPDRVELLLHLVDVLAVQGKRLDAAQILERAANLRPSDAELQLHASEAYGLADRPVDAARYNDRALALHPDDRALLERRADLAIWLGANALAAETLKTLSEANPDDLKFRRDLAKVLGWQGHWDEATRVLSEYVADHGNNKDALIDLARIQSAAGDTDAAQESLKRYVAAGGSEDNYRDELAKLTSDINAPIRAEMEKRYGDAERMYREILSRQPDRADVLQRLVDLLATEGKRLEAAQAMATLANLKRDDGDLQLRASEAFGAAGRLADAVRYADRALALRPADPGLRRRRAALDVWAGKYAAAEKILRSLIASDPDDATLKRDLGRVLATRRPAEAAELLSRYTDQHPEDKEALLDLARVNEARGRPRENAKVLERYREAGGDEAAYRREVARPRPPKLSPARSKAGAGTAAAPSDIPAAVIKAEEAKRWDEAVRLLQNRLAKEPNSVSLWLRLVDNLAVQKKPLGAAQAMAKAADLRSDDADLQLRASQAFGAAGRPAEALQYVNRAIAIRPNGIELHRRRAELATWAGNNVQAEESLRILIDAGLGDLKLRLDLGRVVGWQDRLEEAADILSDYVAQRPTEKEGLLALSRVEAGRGDLAAAVDLLGRYSMSGGDALTYRRDFALDLAWAGRIYTPLEIADAGLASNPGDFNFHLARSVALLNGYAYDAAAGEVDRMAQLRPTAAELIGLRRSIETPMRSYLQFDAGGRWGTDNVSAQAAEVSYHQRLDDIWSVFASGSGDLAQALRASGFAPIRGGTSMGRGGGGIGAQARLDLGTAVTARVGATSTGDTTEATWLVGLDTRLSDELRLQLSNMRDLQAITPRSLSLGITRIDTTAQLTYTPDLSWTIAATLQEGELSDNNHFWHVAAAPRRAVVRTQHWNVDLGIGGNWYGYSRNPPQDGYYSPSFYQHYMMTSYIYYKMSDEDGISLIASFGANKDQLMTRFKFTQDYGAEATFGSLSEWTFKIRGAYTNHGSLGPSFSAESIGLTVIKRF